MISTLLTSLQGSLIAQINALVKKRVAEGHNIIHLGIGQPDFQPTKPILDATIDAINKGKTTYTVSRGIPELREAISQAYNEDYRVSIDPQSEIVITTGSKLGLLASVLTILDRGDSILVPEPRWVSYTDIIKLARAKSIPIPMMPDFSLNQDEILSQINKDNAKAIIINFPNNPTGHALSPEETRFLHDIVEDHNIIIISDEIYNDYIYIDNPVRTLLTEFNDWRQNIVIINGLSKSFSMTGYRVGYTISHPEIAGGIVKVIEASTSCPTNFCQWAGITAIKNRNQTRDLINQIFPKRRDIFLQEIEKTNGLSIGSIDGAFYGFIKYDFSNKSSDIIAKEILENANVCLIPGVAFGSSAEGYLRATFARSIEEIQEAFQRIRTYLKQ